MTIAPVVPMPEPGRPSRRLGAAIRAEIARQGITQGDVSLRLGRPQSWLSRRISVSAPIDLTIEEVMEITKALGVPAEGLVLYAIRDLNPEPADLEHCRVISLFGERAA